MIWNLNATWIKRRQKCGLCVRQVADILKAPFPFLWFIYFYTLYLLLNEQIKFKKKLGSTNSVH